MTDFQVYSTWFPWEKISNKPIEFNPIPHLHSVNDIVGYNKTWDIASDDTMNAIYPKLNNVKNINFINHTYEEQHINLWSMYYGIGVQNYTTYFRTHYDFAWFFRGFHSPTRNDPGLGGKLMMILKETGKLGINEIQPETTLDVNGSTQTSFIQFKDRTKPDKPYNVRKYTNGLYRESGLNGTGLLLTINITELDKKGWLNGKIYGYQDNSIYETSIGLWYEKNISGSLLVRFNTYNIVGSINYPEPLLKCYKNGINPDNIIYIVYTFGEYWVGVGWDLLSFEPDNGVNIDIEGKFTEFDTSSHIQITENTLYAFKPAGNF